MKKGLAFLLFVLLMGFNVCNGSNSMNVVHAAIQYQTVEVSLADGYTFQNVDVDIGKTVNVIVKNDVNYDYTWYYKKSGEGIRYDLDSTTKKVVLDGSIFKDISIELYGEAQGSEGKIRVKLIPESRNQKITKEDYFRVPSDGMYYDFVPTVTGVYFIGGRDGDDTSFRIYDERYKEVKTKATEKNVSYQRYCEMVEGHVYHIYASSNSEEGQLCCRYTEEVEYEEMIPTAFYFEDEMGNNSKEDAMGIPLEYKECAEINGFCAVPSSWNSAEESSEDWYKIVLQEGGRLRFSHLRTDDASNGTIDLLMYDEAGNEYTIMERSVYALNKENEASRYTDTYLSAGTYYFYVKANMSDCRYRLYFQLDDVGEGIDYQSVDKVPAYTINTIKTGFVMKKSERPEINNELYLYKVVIPQRGKYEFTYIENRGVNNLSYGYCDELIIEDTTGRNVVKLHTRDCLTEKNYEMMENEEYDSTYSLDAGTYYIRIGGNTASNYSFEFSICNDGVTTPSSSETVTTTEKTTEATTTTEKPTEKPTESTAITEKPTEKPTESTATTEKTTEVTTEITTEHTTQQPEKPVDIGEENFDNYQLYSIWALKEKVTYNLGDELDLSDIHVWGSYVDAKYGIHFREFTASEYDVDISDVNMNSIRNSQKIVVTAKANSECTSTIDLDVLEKEEGVNKQLVRVKAEPRKLNYYVGETFSKANVKVEALYADGSYRELAPSEYTMDLSEVDMSKSLLYFVLVEYEEDGEKSSDSFVISVYDKPVPETTESTTTVEKPTEEVIIIEKTTENIVEDTTERVTEQPTIPSVEQSTQDNTSTNENVTIVTPTKISGVKLTNKKGKKLSITWKKERNSSAYQIQIATNRKFSKGKKQKTASTNSLVWKKLKKGTTYYVRVRGYVQVDGMKIVGNWSSVKKLKIKK